jgi:hypothetical protein
MNTIDEAQITWDWKSKSSIGPIKLGEPATETIYKYSLPIIQEYSDSEEDVYEFPDETTIRVEDGLISSISCKSNFIYRGTNLIGLSIEEIRALLGNEYIVDDDFEEQICLEFDEYSLMIWLSKQTKKVESVSCF